MSAAERLDVVRTLRDVALEVRVYVQAAELRDEALLRLPPPTDASLLLERIDGAIADAEEVLS